MECEHVKGTTKAKVRLLLRILAVLFLYALYRYAWFVYVPDIDAQVISEIELKEYAKTASILNVTFSGTILIVSLYVAFILYTFGRHVQLSMQYPPPRVDMPFTTKIVRGNKAIDLARFLYVSSVLVIVYGVLRIMVNLYVVTRIGELVNGF